MGIVKPNWCSHLSAGEDLLAAVVASRWNPVRLSQLPALANRVTPDDWSRAVAWHGLAGILRRLHQPALDQLPAELAGIPAVIHDRHVPQALRQFRELMHLHGALKDAGVPHVPLKGVILSLQLYGDVAARISTDIDILIDPDDFSRAYAALSNAGYECVTDYPVGLGARKLLLNAVHETKWRSASGIPIEIQHRNELLPTMSLPRLRQLEPYLSEIRFGPVAVCTLPDGFLLEAIAAHCARSCCYSWKWGYDVLHMATNGIGEFGSPSSRAERGRWWRDISTTMLRAQLGEDLSDVAVRARRAARHLGAMGVEQRRTEVRGTRLHRFDVTRRQKIRMIVAKLYMHPTLNMRLKWVLYHAFRFDPDGSIWSRIAAIVPILSPVIRAFRFICNKRDARNNLED